MITEALVNYIKSQNIKNVSKEQIISRLVEVGWHLDDIQEGLTKAIPPKEEITPEKIETPQIPEVKKDYNIDPYHEPIDAELEPLAIKLEKPKIIEPIKKVEPPIEPIKEITQTKIDSEGKEVESSKIWVPSAIKPVMEVDVEQEKPIIKPVSTRTLEIFEPELEKPKEIIKNTFVKPIIKEIKIEKDDKELFPTLTPKPTVDQKESTITWDFKPQQPIKKEEKIPEIKIENIVAPKENLEISNDNKIEEKEEAKTLSKIAMISSYSQDYMSANKLKLEVSKRERNNLLKWLVIILVICILGGTTFVFANGYIKIPNIQIPFVKKDAKISLLNNADSFALLKSYKVETEASISLPSFANITSGLMNGESADSSDKDSFSFKALGKVDKNGNSARFDYDLVLNSSMLEKEIKTNFKYDGINSYINIPDLTSIFKKGSPTPGIILVSKEQIKETSVLLPDSLKGKVDKVDLLKMLPSANLGSVNNQFSTSFKDFISKIKTIKKGEQEIHGINTYHYSISVDRPEIKKFLNDISGILLMGLSDQDKVKIEEILGTVSVDSFEVWIGKKDSNVYQYKIALSVPLSKIIGLEDKGIADNKVVLDWQTTYYDLDVPNSINIPSESIPFDELMKSINDIKIKNTISSFTSSAKIMKNALGNYGNKSNTKGSCTEPVPGSLFSPLGHTKGASTVVGMIASTMNTIVEQTSGIPLCYSTSKAWAIASPLASNPTSYFCVDSAGNSVVLNSPLAKTVCQ